MSKQETKQIKKTLSHLQDDKRKSKISRKNAIGYDLYRLWWKTYSRKQVDTGKQLNAAERKEAVQDFIDRHNITASEMRYQYVHPALRQFIKQETRKMNKDVQYQLSTILTDYMAHPSISEDYTDAKTLHNKTLSEKFGSVPVDFTETRTENKMFLNGIYAPSAYTEVLREEAAEMTDEEREEELKILVDKLSGSEEALKSFAKRNGVPAGKLANGIAKLKKRKIKTCTHCSNPFFAKDGRSKYCSEGCSSEARAMRDKYRYRNK